MWITLKPFADEARVEALCEKARKLECRLIDLLPSDGRGRWVAGDRRWTRFERRLRRIDELNAIRRWLMCWRDTCQGIAGREWRSLA